MNDCRKVQRVIIGQLLTTNVLVEHHIRAVYTSQLPSADNNTLYAPRRQLF